MADRQGTVTSSDIRDLEALHELVTRAAAVTSTLWLTYLGVLFYLLIAISSVTHRALFLESRMELPFMQISISMNGFFLLGPILFVGFHMYVLLHFSILSGKIVAWEEAVASHRQEVQAKWRLRLPSNFLVQVLAGPPEVRGGATALLLWIILLLSLVVAPVLLIMFFIVQYLPQHDIVTTWGQRFALVSDLALLWFFRRCSPAPRTDLVNIQESPTVMAVRTIRRIGTTFTFLILTCGTPLFILIATFPGEGLLYNVSQSAPFRYFSLDGDLNKKTLVSDSLFSNRMLLPLLKNVDDGTNSAGLPYVTYARNLRMADMKLADLSGLNLIYSDLTEARLGSAHFQYAKLDHATLAKAHLKYADLSHASLLHANLRDANLAHASLAYAKLSDANLRNTKLVDANLAHANLAGADLTHADLTRANLLDTNLSGADLNGAKFSRIQLREACGRPVMSPVGFELRPCNPSPGTVTLISNERGF